MNYLSLERILKENGKALFSLQDAEALFPGTAPKTVKNNLSNWVGKGLVRRLRRNVYELVSPGKEVPDYYLANSLYSPSYVSLETALSFYGIIPEEAAAVTSVSTKPTRTFRNQRGLFIYRTCKKEAYTGYRIMRIEGYKTLIADREKAFVDHIYFRLLEGEKDYSHERFDLSKVRKGKSRGYAKLFDKKTHKTVEELLSK
ncbi:MAG: hypothetical protein JW724_07870 [Candidatus Altiarchaeota archaeon]|nr:hypothetical protein [Candidatus Altiarchaeota archaeon]